MYTIEKNLTRLRNNNSTYFLDPREISLIKGKLKGCGFSGSGHRRKGFPQAPHKVSGQFHYRHCIIEANNYGTDNLFEQVNTYLNNLQPTKVEEDDDFDSDRQYEIDRFIEELYNY